MNSRIEKTRESHQVSSLPTTQLKRSFTPPAFAPTAGTTQTMTSPDGNSLSQTGENETSSQTEGHAQLDRIQENLSDSPETTLGLDSSTGDLAANDFQEASGLNPKEDLKRWANLIAGFLKQGRYRAARSRFFQYQGKQKQKLALLILSQCKDHHLVFCHSDFYNALERAIEGAFMGTTGMLEAIQNGDKALFDQQSPRFSAIDEARKKIGTAVIDNYHKDALPSAEFKTFQAQVSGLKGKVSAGAFLALQEKEMQFLLKFIQREGELSTQAIAKWRSKIASYPDGSIKGQLYAELQKKVHYMNQRNNSEWSGEKLHGGTCNLTALGMNLSYLGLSVPKADQDYTLPKAKDKNNKELDSPSDMNKVFGEDDKYVNQLDNIRRNADTVVSREEYLGWGNVASELGAEHKMILWRKLAPKEWWMNTVKAKHLDKGHAIMIGIGDHIVRLQDVEKDGLRTDDPYGKTQLLAGKQISPNRVNNSKRKNFKDKDYNGNSIKGHKDNEGENNLWSWDSVKTHRFEWVIALWNASEKK